MHEPRKGQIKLASKLAGMIGQHIIDEGWRVGSFLGTEAELVERYGVSRWTVREAIAIAERDGLVERRRGHGGGLFVAAPAAGAVAAAIRNYFEFAHLRIEDVLTTRQALEELALSLAATRITSEQIDELRTLVARATDCPDDSLINVIFELLAKLLEATQSTVLKVFVESLSQLTVVAGMYSSISDRDFVATLRQLRDIRIQQAEAVIGADVGRLHHLLAVHRALSEKTFNLKHLMNGQSISAHARTRAQSVLPSVARGTRSEAVAQRIQAEIIAAGWPVGHHLGSEAELATHYKVSRLVFREVVRVLEELGVVEMHKGRHSGLKVSTPRPDVVIAKAKVYLLYADIAREDVYAVQTVLEVKLVGAMAESPQHAQIGAALHALAEPELSRNARAVAERVEQFYQALLAHSDNPVIVLFLRIFSEMFVLRKPASRLDEKLTPTVDAVRAQQLAIATAIAGGDAMLARRALNRLRAEVMQFELRYKSAARIIADD